LLLLLVNLQISNAQVGIGTINPNVSSILDLTSNSHGLPGSPNDNRAKKFDFKPCRWTLIYNTTRSGFNIMMLVGKIMELMQSATAVMD
jgi:hypothetical protein